MSAQARLTADLDERIADAFTKATTSADVAGLIEEAQSAAVSSGEAAETARTRALDPVLSAADVAAARREMEDAAFRRDRMGEAVRRLGDRLREVRRQEDQARRRVAYEAALAERDALAKELVEVYPRLAEQLAEIVGRIAANDAVIERVNRKSLPDGAGGLASAEAVARGVPGNFLECGADVPRLTRDLRIPAFHFGSTEAAYLWPEPERRLASTSRSRAA